MKEGKTLSWPTGAPEGAEAHECGKQRLEAPELNATCEEM